MDTAMPWIVATRPRALAILIAILCLLSSANAKPSVALPFNAQVPPVARLNQPYNFSFANTTFDSDGGTLQYSLTNGPAWLQFESAYQSLLGIPGPADVGVNKFSITATDEAGQWTQMQCTLIVSSSPAPEFSVDMVDILGQSGNLAGPTTLQVQPDEQVEVDFSPSSFDGPHKMYYYATLADHTPLPDWMSFDSASLQFSAKAPKLQPSPQDFNILLIASDVAGFAGVTQTWTLRASNQAWFFQPQEQTIDVPKGGTVNVTNLLASLKSGGSTARATDISHASAPLPSWLKFDNESLALTGQPPANVKALDTKVTAWDRFGNSANLTLHVRMYSLFQGEIGPFVVKQGEDFQFFINKSVLAQSSESIVIDTMNVSWLNWITLKSGDIKLFGTAPSDIAPGTVAIKITAASSDQSQSDTKDVKISIRKGKGGEAPSRVTSMTTSATSKPTSTSARSNSAHVTPSQDKHKTKIIVGAVVGSVSGLALLTLLICCCRRSNRRHSKTITKADISRPTYEYKDPEMLDLERNMTSRAATLRTSLLMSVPSSVRRFGSRTIPGLQVNGKIVEIDENEVGLYRSHIHRESLKMVTEMARGTQTSPNIQGHPFRATGSSGVSARRDSKDGGFLRPDNKTPGELTSIALDPPKVDRSSVRASMLSNLTSILSSTGPGPSIHGAPAGWKTPLSIEMPGALKRKSTMKSSVSGETPDARPLDVKRESYIRHRSQHRSPFFASNRASTLSRFDWRKGMTAEGLVVKLDTPMEPTYSIMSRPSHKKLRRTSSQISTIEPLRIQKAAKKKSERFRVFPEGFPRPLTIRESFRNSQFRDSLSNFRFSLNTDPDSKRRSFMNRFTQNDDDFSKATANTQSTGSAMTGVAYTDVPAAKSRPSLQIITGFPLTEPPSQPLPELPPKSPRRSLVKRKSGTALAASDDEDDGWIEEYPPHESPTIEEPGIARMVGRAKASQTSMRKSQNFSRKLGRRKQSVDSRAGSMLNRPRSSFRGGLSRRESSAMGTKVMRPEGGKRNRESKLFI